MLVALWSLFVESFAFICASLLSVVLLKELFRSVLFIENRWVFLFTLFSSNDPMINSNDCGQRETDSSVITAFICDFWKESLFILPSITSTTTMTSSIQFHSTNSSMTSPSATPALEAPLRICHHTWLQAISRNGWSSFRIQWWWLVRVRTTAMVRSTVCIHGAGRSLRLLCVCRSWFVEDAGSEAVCPLWNDSSNPRGGTLTRHDEHSQHAEPPPPSHSTSSCEHIGIGLCSALNSGWGDKSEDMFQEHYQTP